MSDQDIQESPTSHFAGVTLASAVVAPSSIASLTPPSPPLESVIPIDSRQNDDYLELRRRVRQAGLLEKQPLFYTMKVVVGVACLGIGVAVMALVDGLWWQLLNAVFVGFAFSQVAFIGHDAGHYQIARSARRNELVGLLATFLIAMDLSWWIDKHNRHHANPNVVGEDSDIEVSVLAFTEEQVLSKNIWVRPIIRFQAFFFFPILMLSSISLRFGGITYIFRGGDVKYPVLEPLFLVAHACIYFSLLYFLLGPWHGLLFMLVHQGVAGLLMGGTFAPNHKGMPVFEKDDDIDFLRLQVLTSRNVKAHPITDVVYGGLNYQIEHHLFPSMPRKNLRRAQKIVREFCREKSISYHETSVLGSNLEMLRFLHEVSRPLRTKQA